MVIDRMFGVDGFRKGYDSEEGREYPDKCNGQDDMGPEDQGSALVKADIEDEMAYFQGIAG